MASASEPAHAQLHQEDKHDHLRFFAEKKVTTTPTIVGKTVYFGDSGGNVYAVATVKDQREDDGTPGTTDTRWQSSVEGAVTTPTVVDGIVFLGCENDNVDSGSRKTIYALDASNGEKIWTATTQDIVSTSPAVVNGTVYIGSNDTNLYALDAATGEVRWKFETGGEITASPTVAEGTVYVVSHDGKLYAIEADTGEKQWENDLPPDQVLETAPTYSVSHKMVYTTAQSHLYGINAESGEIKWELKTNYTREYQLTAPTVVDTDAFDADMLLIATRTADIKALNAATGGSYWSNDTKFDGEPVTPTVMGDTVYYITSDEIYRLNISDGKDTGGAVVTTDLKPTIDSGAIAFVVDNEVYLNSEQPRGHGSSRDSQARLGTIGHPTNWEYANQTITQHSSETANETVNESSGTTRSENSSTVDQEQSEPNHDSSDQPTTDEEMPLLQIGIAGGGFLSATALGGYFVSRRRSNDDEVETTQKEPENTNQIAKETTETRNKADGLVSNAVNNRENGRIETAIEEYTEAAELYKQAAAGTTNNALKADLKQKFDRANAEREQIVNLREARSTFREALTIAETKFQTAIVSHVINDKTAARLNYRQARDEFRRAINEIENSERDLLEEPLQMSITEDDDLPSTTIGELFDTQTADALATGGVTTVSDIQNSQCEVEDGRAVVGQIEQLRTELDLDKQTVLQLSSLYFWHSDKTYTFRSREEINRRYAHTAAIYDHLSENS